MKNSFERKFSGIRMSSFILWMFLATSALFVFLIYITFVVSTNFMNLYTHERNLVASMHYNNQLRFGSDYLTEQVRLFSETGDMTYMTNYFREVKETRRRDHAMEHYREIFADEKNALTLAQALELSNELMKKEYLSMRLIADCYGIPENILPGEILSVKYSASEEGLSAAQKEVLGRKYVFDREYQQAKERIYSCLNRLIEENHSMTKNSAEQEALLFSEKLSQQRALIVCLFIIDILTFALVAFLVAKPLRFFVRSIKNNELVQIGGVAELRYLGMVYNRICKTNLMNQKILYNKANHDKLTGLLNREAFDSITAQLENKPVDIGFLLVDVDNFKTVNDTFGHACGDAVLKKVADSLKKAFRSDDHIFRFGGDEFCVIAMNTNRNYSHIIAQRIAAINAALSETADNLPKVSLSVGVSFSGEGYTQQLFARADEAVYEVKNGGKCGCAVK